MRRLISRWLALVVLLTVSACSLLVDTSELNAQCGPGMKYCDEKCVSVNEPFYGCSLTACDVPCPGQHIVHRCENGECKFAACQQGWGCEDCETNLLTDDSRCGSCTHSCRRDLGETCSAGYCVSADGGRIPRGAGGEGGGGP